MSRGGFGLPSAGVALFAATAVAGCFPPDDGQVPPLDRLYFPVGLAVNPEATRLYVANSDFDLQFNAGTLQAYDLEALRATVPQPCDRDEDCTAARDGTPRGYRCDTTSTPENGGVPSYFCVDPIDPRPCGTRGEKSVAEALVAPGRCAFVDETPLIAASVRIGAFVTDIVYRSRRDATGNVVSGGGGRLFMPVRGDATLHWVDVSSVAPGSRPPGELECGQGSDGSCDADHRRGDDPEQENTRGARLPPEPFGIAADEIGEAVVTTHQSDGALALFVNSWADGGSLDGPRLQFVLTGLPRGALGVAAVPKSRLVLDSQATADPIEYEQGFLVTFRNSAEVRLARYIPDRSRPFLEASRSAPITANALGWNSRGLAIDDSSRKQCEAGCSVSTDLRACELACVKDHALDVYVANRTPASLLIGKTRASDAASGTDDLPYFYDTLAVSLGVSRVVIGNVKGKDGLPTARVFAVCFDSKRIFVYDPRARRVEAIIQTGSGPHALAIDEASGLGYVAHFSESYLGVVDLDQSHPNSYGKMLLTVGKPTPPRASK